MLGTGRLKKLVPGCVSVLSENSGGKADQLVKEGNTIKFGNQSLEVAETPGHTAGCVTYIDRYVQFYTFSHLTLGTGFDDSFEILSNFPTPQIF